MNKQACFTNFLYSLKRLGKQVSIFMIGFLLVLAATGIVRSALEIITNLHWSLGLIAAVMTLIGLVLIINWIKKAPYTPTQFGCYPKLGLALNLFLVVFIATVAIAFVSFILYRLEFVDFTSKDPISVPRLMDYYGWHFIDLIPIVAIWDILGIPQSRIQANDTDARVLLEVFRVLIVLTVIRTFMSKKGNFKRLLNAARAYQLDEKYHKAEVTMDIAIQIAERSDDPVELADANIEYARIFIKQSPDKATAYLEAASKQIERAAKEADLKARQLNIEKLRNYKCIGSESLELKV